MRRDVAADGRVEMRREATADRRVAVRREATADGRVEMPRSGMGAIRRSWVRTDRGYAAHYVRGSG